MVHTRTHLSLRRRVPRPSLRLAARRRRKRLLMGVVLAVVIGAAAWMVFMTALFRVHGVRIEGAVRLDPKVLEAELQALIGKHNHMLLLSASLVSASFQERFPQLASATLRRRFFNFPPRHRADLLTNVVVLEVQERAPLGVSCRDRCFLFDREGYLFEEALSSSSTPTVYDKRNVSYALRSRVFTPAIAEALEALLNHFHQVEVPLAHMELADYEITATTAEGWAAIFASDRPMAEQLRALTVLLEQEVGDRRAALEYVDVTIANRAYYRFRK